MENRVNESEGVREGWGLACAPHFYSHAAVWRCRVWVWWGGIFTSAINAFKLINIMRRVSVHSYSIWGAKYKEIQLFTSRTWKTNCSLVFKPNTVHSFQSFCVMHHVLSLIFNSPQPQKLLLNINTNTLNLHLNINTSWILHILCNI